MTLGFVPAALRCVTVDLITKHWQWISGNQPRSFHNKFVPHDDAFTVAATLQTSEGAARNSSVRKRRPLLIIPDRL